MEKYVIFGVSIKMSEFMKNHGFWTPYKHMFSDVINMGII